MTHKAFEGAETTSLVASLNIVGLDEAFTHVQAALSLAAELFIISVSIEVVVPSNIIIVLRVLVEISSSSSGNRLVVLRNVLNSLEAVEGACSLILSAFYRVKCLDQAFGSVNSTVLLADCILDVSLNLLDSLKAIKSAASLSFNASLHIECLDEALSIVDGTVLLADADISVDSCGQAGKSEKDTSHLIIIIYYISTFISAK